MLRLRRICRDLVEPSSNMRTFGDRSFVVFAPRLWNSLPLQYVGVHLLTFLKMLQNLIVLKSLSGDVCKFSLF